MQIRISLLLLLFMAAASAPAREMNEHRKIMKREMAFDPDRGSETEGLTSATLENDEQKNSYPAPEMLEQPRYSIPGDLVLPSIVAVDDEVTDAKRNETGVKNAASYVMQRINEAKLRCKLARTVPFTRADVIYAMEHAGMGVGYILELKLSGRAMAEIYHVSVQQLLDFERSIVKSVLTGKEEVLDHRINSIQPNPCKSRELAHTFLEMKAHNSNPRNTWKSSMYSRFFAKTWDYVSETSFGSFDSKVADILDPELLLEVDTEELGDYVPPVKYVERSSATEQIFDQGECGCCYAAAAATVVGARITHVTNGETDPRLSVDEIMDCVIGGCEGSNAESVFGRMKQTSISEDWCLPDRRMLLTAPYRERKRVPTGGGFCGAACISTTNTFSAKWGLTDFRVLNLSGMQAATRVLAIQKEIETNGPVYASIAITNDFITYQTGIYTPTSASKPIGSSHAVAIIGWGFDGLTHYWLVQNSYSENWGEDGFARIKMGIDAMEIESRGVWLPVVNPVPTNGVAKCPNWGKCQGGNVDSACNCRCNAPMSGTNCEVSLGDTACGTGKADGSKCKCYGATKKDTSGKCSFVQASLNYDYWCSTNSRAIEILWNFPSRVGSYCEFFYLAEGPVPGTQISLCGNVSEYTLNNAWCRPEGKVEIPRSLLLAMSSGNYVVKCFEYLGLNEFQTSRGFAVMRSENKINGGKYNLNAQRNVVSIMSIFNADRAASLKHYANKDFSTDMTGGIIKAIPRGTTVRQQFQMSSNNKNMKRLANQYKKIEELSWDTNDIPGQSDRKDLEYKCYGITKEAPPTLQKLPQEGIPLPLSNQKAIDKHNTVFNVKSDGNLYSKCQPKECTVILDNLDRVMFNWSNKLNAVKPNGEITPLDGQVELYIVDSNGQVVRAVDNSQREAATNNGYYFSIPKGTFVGRKLTASGGKDESGNRAVGSDSTQYHGHGAKEKEEGTASLGGKAGATVPTPKTAINNMPSGPNNAKNTKTALPKAPMQQATKATLPKAPMQQATKTALPKAPMQQATKTALPKAPMQQATKTALPKAPMQQVAKTALPKAPMQQATKTALPKAPTNGVMKAPDARVMNGNGFKNGQGIAKKQAGGLPTKKKKN